MKRKWKAAIIGGGFSGNIHAGALAACGVELAVVVATRRESARKFAGQWNVPLYGTDPSIAFGEEIDAVHICTPPASHGEYIREAIRAGKHVLCEKPLSLDAEEAKALATLAEKSKVRCATCFNVRYHMAVQKARELIRSGEFGRPLLIHGNYLQEFHVLPAPYDWRYDPVASGGMRAVSEIGTHWFDAAQYVSGKHITAVSATFANFFPERSLKDGMMDIASPAWPGVMDAASPDMRGVMDVASPDMCGVMDAASPDMPGQMKTASPAESFGQRLHVDSEDAACITFRMEDGVMGNVLLSEISPGRGNHLSLEITCERGNLWWNEEENNVLHTARKGEGIRTEVFAFGNGFQDTFSSLLRSFYEGSGYPDFGDAAGVSRICAAAVESAAENSAWVSVI